MLRPFLITALVLLAPLVAYSGEILDRLAANVNGHALLQSEVDQELRYECFAAKRPLSEISAEDTDGALDRLIDQQLLREQMRSTDFKAVDAPEVEKAFQTFKSGYGTPKSWETALAIYRISEAEIKDHIDTELNQLRLIDLRLRPSIQIDAESVQNYYQQQVLPKLPPGQHPGLQESTPAIRELLIQQRMNEALDAWLAALRAQARIKRLPQALGDQHK